MKKKVIPLLLFVILYTARTNSVDNDVYNWRGGGGKRARAGRVTEEVEMLYNMTKPSFLEEFIAKQRWDQILKDEIRRDIVNMAKFSVLEFGHGAGKTSMLLGKAFQEATILVHDSDVVRDAYKVHASQKYISASNAVSSCERV